MCFRRKPIAESGRAGELKRRSAHGVSRSAAAFALTAAALMLSPGAILSAQANPAETPQAAQAHKHSAHATQKPAAATPAPQTAPQPEPAAPKPPDWPANDLPGQASVVFDSRGLLIVASNSSLEQILKDVATDTGAQVEGMGQDERVFGTYGPAPASDVLTQILEGSGYNVLLIGDRGAGTPRRIVLSAQAGSGGPHTPAGGAGPSDNNEDNDAEQQAPEPQAEQPPQPQQQQPPQGSFAPPVPARTPQQIIEELQQRQRQIQQGQQPQPPQ